LWKIGLSFQKIYNFFRIISKTMLVLKNSFVFWGKLFKIFVNMCYAFDNNFSKIFLQKHKIIVFRRSMSFKILLRKRFFDPNFYFVAKNLNFTKVSVIMPKKGGVTLRHLVKKADMKIYIPVYICHSMQ
jgi:hypothetical protein